jgi:hypothetical protein
MTGLEMGSEWADEMARLEARWRTREREWARRLGRLRLGVEPLDEQLARYRRVTWGLTLVPAIIALMFLALFSVFGRPDIGFFIVLFGFVPIILFSWIGYRKLERRAKAYLTERSEFESERNRIMNGVENNTSPDGR